MPAERDNVLHQLVVGDAAAIAEIVERARISEDVTTLVAAALFTLDGRNELIVRAESMAATAKDRQLVAIAAAHLAGDVDRVEDLARDHLADHPDSVLVAWITAAGNHAGTTRKDLS
jgi:hypothetical protein